MESGQGGPRNHQRDHESGGGLPRNAGTLSVTVKMCVREGAPRSSVLMMLAWAHVVPCVRILYIRLACTPCLLMVCLAMQWKCSSWPQLSVRNRLTLSCAVG